KEANKEFFDNYLLQIEVSFDADTTEAIKADDAVIANAGKDELVTFTSMPEEEETYTVTADVEDFEMEGIDLSGIPSTMSIDAPDTDEMTDEIKTLSESIADVNQGVADVNQGVADVKQGIGELNQGSSELANGSEEYMAGINELDASSGELIDGSSEMNEALQTLDSELQKIDDID